MKGIVLFFLLAGVFCFKIQNSRHSKEFPTQIHCFPQLVQKITAVAELAYTYYGNNIQKNVAYINSKLTESTGWTVAIIPNYINDIETQTFIEFGWYICGIRQQILKYQPNWLYVISDQYLQSTYFTEQLSFQKNQKGNMTDELSSVIINTITLSRKIYPDNYLAQYNFIWDALKQYNGNSYGFGACKKQQSKHP